MLKDTEWKLLTDAVSNHLLNTVDPHGALALILPADFIAQLELGARSGQNARRLVRRLREEGLRGDPPPLLVVLEALLDAGEFAADARSQPVRDIQVRVELELRRRASDDPFLISVLAGDEVFIDRVPLREALRELHEGDQLKVLLQVAGGPSTGKSYTARLIGHLATECGFHRARAFLDDETGTPDEIVRLLSMDLAGTDATPPARGGDPAKWYGRASEWLVIRARERGGKWWFIIDGLNHLPQTSEVWDFVQRLALTVDRYGDSQVRLVLLGHDRAFGGELRRRFLRDEVRTLTKADVQEFLTIWMRDRNERLPAPARRDDDQLDRDVDETVDEVIGFAEQKVREEGCCFMTELGHAVEEAILELRE